MLITVTDLQKEFREAWMLFGIEHHRDRGASREEILRIMWTQRCRQQIDCPITAAEQIRLLIEVLEACGDMSLGTQRPHAGVEGILRVERLVGILPMEFENLRRDGFRQSQHGNTCSISYPAVLLPDVPAFPFADPANEMSVHVSDKLCMPD